MSNDTRYETDSMGDVPVPAQRYWGAQTERSRRNFPIGNERMPDALVESLAKVKWAAARVNSRRGRLALPLAEAIEQAAQEVCEGKHRADFPLVIWQTGSGTQTNMNVNEVIANRANEILGSPLGSKSPVHPNDHVNMSQSSNDSVPTAMHLSALQVIEDQTVPAVRALARSFRAHEKGWHDIIKIGRTHLMDATPIRLGQEMGGYASQLEAASTRIERSLDELRELAIGATAVGTGLNAPEGWSADMARELSELCERTLSPAPNPCAAIASHDAIVAAHGALKTAACALMKIANDVRFLASGPRCGLGELSLPANEPGSSIMPGKVNPTQCEALLMVCAQVVGNDSAMAVAGASGNFELNVYKPLMGSLILQSAGLLADATSSFRERCIEGMQPNRKRMEELVASSLMLVTALAPRIGYDLAAAVAKRAFAQGETLREAALAMKVLSEAELDELLDATAMTGA